jgi:uncharacterized protein YdhG (YjbR/CyaY superfamily)
MRHYVAKDVDEYIDLAPNEAQPVLKGIRKAIKKAYKDVDERISWGIPFYRYHGYLIGYSYFKKHASFGFTNILTDEDKKIFNELGYKTGNKSVQVRYDQKVPEEQIVKIVRARGSLNIKREQQKAETTS